MPQQGTNPFTGLFSAPPPATGGNQDVDNSSDDPEKWTDLQRLAAGLPPKKSKGSKAAPPPTDEQDLAELQGQMGLSPNMKQPKENPFSTLFANPVTDDTGTKRMQAEQASIQATILKLKSIVPHDEGHKARLQKLTDALTAQYEGHAPGRGVLEELVRGNAVGFTSALQFPVELAGDLAAITGHKDLQNYVEENKTLLEEEWNPRGKAGKIGEIAGGIVGSAAASGGLAELAGKGIIYAAPSSKLAAIVAKGAASGWKARAATNVVTGLPMNATMAMGGPEIEVPEGASPEEAQRIREMNTANKIKQLAIGIGADALFGLIPHGKAKADKIGLDIGSKSPESKWKDLGFDVDAHGDIALEPMITPERQAQLDRVKAQNAVKVTAKLKEQKLKKSARLEWELQNPDFEWKEVKGAEKRKIYDDYATRQSNTNPDTSVEGTTDQQKQQLASLHDELKNMRGERDEAVRLRETDDLLGIGSAVALRRAAPGIDKNPKQVYIVFDINGMKDVNDEMGYGVGDQLLKDARDATIAGHVENGQVKPDGSPSHRLFRMHEGGDELIAATSLDIAESIRDASEKKSVKQYGTKTGSMTGVIFHTLAEAESAEGKALLTARKLEHKARQGIAGRSSQEQALIDAVRLRQNTEPPPVVAAERPLPFPPEVMHAIGEVSQAGGLQSEESHQAFAKEIARVYSGEELKPEQVASELQALIENFTPFHVDAPAPELPPGELVPAIRTKEGRIFQGAIHPLAVREAVEKGAFGGRPPAEAGYEAGFMTKEGKFLTRHEALSHVKENELPIRTKEADRLGEGLDALDIPTKVRSKITAGERKVPVDPIEAKLAEIKARVARGETHTHAFPEPKPAEQGKKRFISWEDVKQAEKMSAEMPGEKPLHLKATNETMTIRELHEFNSIRGGVNERLNNLKRLGALRRFAAEGGSITDPEGIPGLNTLHNKDLKIEVEKQIKAAEHNASFNEMTTKEVREALDDPSFVSHEEAVAADKSANEIKNKTESLIRMAVYDVAQGDPLKLNELKVRDLAQLTNKTPSEIEAEVMAAIPKEATRSLEFNLNTARDHPDENVRKSFAKKAENLKNYLDPPVVEKKTVLQAIEHKKPLEKMTEKELSKLDDKLTDALDAVPKDSPEYKIIQKDFDAVHEEYKRRNTEAEANKAPPAATPLPEGMVIRPKYSDTNVQQVVGGGKARPKDLPATLIDKELLRLRSTSPRKMTDGEMELHLRDLETQRRDAVTHDDAKVVQKKIDKVLLERAFREKAINGAVPGVPPTAIQGTAGFMFGFIQPISANATEDEKKSDRLTNALMWTGLAVGSAFALRMAARAKSVRAGEVHLASDRWPGSTEAEKKIVNQADIEVNPKHWLERARDWYTGIVRRSYGMDRAVAQMNGTALAASKNPAKLIAMFGRWVSQAEGALMDQPSYTDLAGNVIPLPTVSFRAISDMVEGDIKGLGKLMAARASIEGQGLRKVPFDAVTADLIFHNAPENYHKAADAVRQFDLAMTTVLENSGVIAPGSGERFSSEEFYAGLKRVFDPDGGPSKIVRDSKTGKLIVSPNPVKGRAGGHQGQIYNPAETSAAMVPQIYRAAELNNIKNRLKELWEAAGKPDNLLKQVERRKQPISIDQQLRVDALKQEIKGMTQADAESIVAAFDPKSLDPRSNVMTMYVDGVLKAYKVDEHIATAMASLHPEELEGLWKFLGLPASVARKGVVLNPYFVVKQSFIDNWQATLNSQYGFRFGVDQFIGWYNTMSHSKEYQMFIAAGGGHSTLQSHEFVNVKTALASVSHGGGSPMNVAVKQLKELKVIDAYKTMIIPFSEAARVGEYLRARGQGASALDGVYAAKHVTANFQQRGSWQAVRALDRASLFLNPAIQGLDQALFRAGVNPFRVPDEGRKAAATKYLAKAFVSITLPSMYFWMANREDQEINDLRKTDAGQKFWFMRSPVDAPKMGMKKGDIVKIPKPIVDGQIFGSTMEAALDKMYGDDPATVHMAASKIAQDISTNILPTMGVLFLGLQTGKDLGTGGNLTPQGDENLSLEHQGEDKASYLSRAISSRIAPVIPDGAPEALKNSVTPAGLDYITRTVGGMLGQDAMTAVTQVMEAETKGYIPAKDELPIISKVFASYPSTNVEPIRNFYERAAKVQEISTTMHHLILEDPGRLAPYMASNQKDYILVGLFDKSRQDIVNYRRAIQNIKDMPAGSLSSEDRHLYIKQYMTLMIETARRANTFAKEIDRVYPE